MSPDYPYYPTEGTTTGRFKITIPYPATISDEKAKNLRIFWINPVTNKWELVGGTVDIINHTVTVEIDHLSIFRIASYTPAASNLTNVIAYPNPCKGHDKITFKDLTDQCKISIYNIAGELIYEQDTNGKAEWNLKNRSGKDVASGVYIYVVTNNQNQKAVGKIGVVK